MHPPAPTIPHGTTTSSSAVPQVTTSSLAEERPNPRNYSAKVKLFVILMAYSWTQSHSLTHIPNIRTSPTTWIIADSYFLFPCMPSLIVILKDFLYMTSFVFLDYLLFLDLPIITCVCLDWPFFFWILVFLITFGLFYLALKNKSQCT